MSLMRRVLQSIHLAGRQQASVMGPLQQGVVLHDMPRSDFNPEDKRQVEELLDRVSKQSLPRGDTSLAK